MSIVRLAISVLEEFSLVILNADGDMQGASPGRLLNLNCNINSVIKINIGIRVRNYVVEVAPCQKQFDGQKLDQ